MLTTGPSGKNLSAKSLPAVLKEAFFTLYCQNHLWGSLGVILFRLPRTLGSQTLVREIYNLEPQGYFYSLKIINSHGKANGFFGFCFVFLSSCHERTNSGFYLLFSPSNKTTKETTLKVIFIASVFSEIQGVFKEQKRSDI